MPHPAFGGAPQHPCRWNDKAHKVNLSAQMSSEPRSGLGLCSPGSMAAAVSQHTCMCSMVSLQSCRCCQESSVCISTVQRHYCSPPLSAAPWHACTTQLRCIKTSCAPSPAELATLYTQLSPVLGNLMLPQQRAPMSSELAAYVCTSVASFSTAPAHTGSCF